MPRTRQEYGAFVCRASLGARASRPHFHPQGLRPGAGETPALPGPLPFAWRCWRRRPAVARRCGSTRRPPTAKPRCCFPRAPSNRCWRIRPRRPTSPRSCALRTPCCASPRASWRCRWKAATAPTRNSPAFPLGTSWPPKSWRSPRCRAAIRWWAASSTAAFSTRPPRNAKPLGWRWNTTYTYIRWSPIPPWAGSTIRCSPASSISPRRSLPNCCSTNSPTA